MQMLEYTMCPGGNCPQKLGCLRYICEPVGRRDFFGSPPYAADGSCTEFLDAQKELRWMINAEESEKLAYGLSTLGMSRDETIWLMARVQLEIDHLIHARHSRLPKKKGLSPAERIVLEPDPVTDEEIQTAAYYLALYFHGTVQDLHWIIAQGHLMQHLLTDKITATLARFLRD
jgi:hypothetical protein